RVRDQSKDVELPDTEILENDFPDPLLVQRQVVQEMQSSVEEREQPEHPAESDEVAQSRNLPQGRDRQRRQEDVERPIAGVARYGFDPVDAQVIVLPSIGEHP